MTARRPVLEAARPALASSLGVAVIVLAWSTLDSFDDSAGFILLLYLFLLAVLWLVLMLAAIVLTAWYGARRHSAFLAMSLVAAVPVAWASVWAGNDLHLLIMLPSYLRQVDSASTTSFDWGVRGTSLASVQRTLVHDPSDTITRLNRESRAGGEASVYVSRLFGHFYVVDERF